MGATEPRNEPTGGRAKGIGLQRNQQQVLTHKIVTKHG